MEASFQHLGCTPRHRCKSQNISSGLLCLLVWDNLRSQLKFIFFHHMYLLCNRSICVFTYTICLAEVLSPFCVYTELPFSRKERNSTYNPQHSLRGQIRGAYLISRLTIETPNLLFLISCIDAQSWPHWSEGRQPRGKTVEALPLGTCLLFVSLV